MVLIAMALLSAVGASEAKATEGMAKNISVITPSITLDKSPCLN